MTTDLLSRLRDDALLQQDEEFVLVPLCREAADEIERLRERWISVTDSLPPSHQNVWCYNRDGSQFEGRICAGLHKPFFTYPRGDGSPSNTAPDWIDVTHWMPLPEPPKMTDMRDLGL